VFVDAKVLSRVSGIKWGVVDFGKLFTETSEQKFSLRGVQCQKICIWQQVLVLQKTTAFLFHKRWWQSVKYGEVSNKVSNRRTKDEPVMTKMSKSGYLRCRQQMSTKYGQVMAKVRWNNAVTDIDSSRYYTRMILWEWWKLNRYIYLGLNRTNVFWAIMECKSKK